MVIAAVNDDGGVLSCIRFKPIWHETLKLEFIFKKEKKYPILLTNLNLSGKANEMQGDHIRNGTYANCIWDTLKIYIICQQLHLKLMKKTVSAESCTRKL